jgi:[protein-PII] uridylyltransferase
VLSKSRDPGHYRDVIAKFEEELGTRIREQKPLEPPPSGRLSRQVKHFPIEPLVNVTRERRGGYFEVAITAADRPGLLSMIARCFLKYELSLHDARITTLGNRAEDVFVVEGEALAKPEGANQLAQDLLLQLKT